MAQDNRIKRYFRNWLGVEQKQEDVAEKVSAVLPMPISGQEPPKKKTGDYLKACESWVYAAVSVICDEIGSVKLHLYKKNQKGIAEIEEHPLLDLLYKVNNFTTKFDHWWSTQQYLELTGEAPWYMERKTMTAKPSQILLLRPDLLDVKFRDDGTKYYEYKIDPTKPIIMEDYEVIFLKYPDPLNAFRGQGTLKAAARTIDLDEYSEKWNVNFFYNSARPDAVLSTEARLTAKEIDDLKRQWQAKFGGFEENPHKVAVLHGGLSYQQMQLSQKEMDFLEQQKFSRDKILSIFRVPKTAIGLTEDVNRANAEATDYVFAARTIKPKMTRIIEQLNEFLAPIYGDNLFLEFEDPTPEDREATVKERIDLVKNGIMTINEARELEGLTPIGEEGNSVLVPFNSQPLGTAEKPKKTLGFKEQRKKLAAREGEENRQIFKKAKELDKKIDQMAREFLKKNHKEPKPEKKETKEAKYWKKQIYITEQYEEKLIKKLKLFFNEQKKRVISDLFGEKAIKFSLPKTILKLSREKALLALVVRPLLKDLMKEEGDEAFSFVGLPDAELDMALEGIQNHLDKHILKMAGSVNKTTINKIRKTLKEGIAEGESVVNLTKRVNSVFREASVSRAAAIARTEVMKAANVASVEAYKQSGVVEAKQWLTALDERTCPWCSDMNGKTIGLEKGFFVEGDKLDVGGKVLNFDYEDIQEPPLHTNCRCTTVPIIVGERQMISNKLDKSIEDIKKEIKEEIEQEKASMKLLDKKRKKELEEKQKKIDERLKRISNNVDKVINEK